MHPILYILFDELQNKENNQLDKIFQLKNEINELNEKINENNFEKENFLKEIKNSYENLLNNLELNESIITEEYKNQILNIFNSKGEEYNNLLGQYLYTFMYQLKMNQTNTIQKFSEAQHFELEMIKKLKSQ